MAASVLRYHADHFAEIAKKTDVEELTILDDEVVYLLEDVHFAELSKLLYIAAELLDQYPEIIAALDWQGARWLADRLRTTMGKFDEKPSS